MYAVVTGGGTSGHVIPAQAILEGLVEAGHSNTDLRYVGSRRGVERQLMADSGVECAYLPISGLQRSFSLRGIAQNALLPLRLFRSSLMARRLITTWHPHVVVSVGGYASEPISRAAIRAGVPLVCVSYDRTPGLATRRQAVHAAVCAVAFPDSQLPRAVHTGAPVRAKIRHLNISLERERSRKELGIPVDRIVVTIAGGSLGSGVLNQLVVNVIDELAPQADSVAIFHVCGPRNATDPLPRVPEGMWYRRVGYEEKMAEVYAATDVYVGRAGASTVAEIATVGLASVLIPWAGAADNHQMKNAQWLGESDAAVVVSEDAAQRGEATRLIANLVTDQPLRERIARHAHALGEPHRGQALIRAIENVAR